MLISYGWRRAFSCFQSGCWPFRSCHFVYLSPLACIGSVSRTLWGSRCFPQEVSVRYPAYFVSQTSLIHLRLLRKSVCFLQFLCILLKWPPIRDRSLVHYFRLECYRSWLRCSWRDRKVSPRSNLYHCSFGNCIFWVNKYLC